MTWIKIDDGFPRHRKVNKLSDVAFRLHVSAMCWCAEQLTDGHIRADEIGDVSTLAPSKVKKGVPELVERGLWDVVDDGWMIHDYLRYNPSREKVNADRDAAAGRQQAWRDRRRNAVTNGVTNGVRNAYPVPPRPDPEGVGSGRGANERSVTRGPLPVDNSEICFEHHARRPCGSCRADLLAGDA